MLPQAGTGPFIPPRAGDGSGALLIVLINWARHTRGKADGEFTVGTDEAPAKCRSCIFFCDGHDLAVEII